MSGLTPERVSALLENAGWPKAWRFRLFNGEWQAVDGDDEVIVTGECDTDVELAAAAPEIAANALRLTAENKALRTELDAYDLEAFAALEAKLARVEALAHRWQERNGHRMSDTVAALRLLAVLADEPNLEESDV